jgi:RNA polymerase sigma-70 factor (ECF subfamily)
MDSEESQETIEILRLASGGDQGAWRLIIERFGPRVFGLLRAHCGDAELAEELTQSTFCTVAQKLSSYHEFGRFESWVFRIGMNRLRDEMRRRKRQATPMEAPVLIGLAGQEKAEDSTFDESDKNYLLDALSQLAELDRQIIDLRHTASMSFRQISELLQEPVGTLLARHHRALKKLKQLIEAGHEPSPEAKKEDI